MIPFYLGVNIGTLTQSNFIGRLNDDNHINKAVLRKQLKNQNGKCEIHFITVKVGTHQPDNQQAGLVGTLSHDSFVCMILSVIFISQCQLKLVLHPLVTKCTLTGCLVLRTKCTKTEMKAA